MGKTMFVLQKHPPLMHKTLLPLLFLATFATAQSPENLAADLPFFEKTADTYQLWLDGCGLGSALRVQEVGLQGDTALVLFLGFQTEDVDSVRAIWAQLRADFAQKMDGEALETVLFEKMGWYFAVSADQSRLYLRDSYRTASAKCWEARVLPKEGRPVFQLRPMECKSQDFEVKIKPSDLPGLAPAAQVDFKNTMGKSAVFKKLENWAVPRFSKPQPDGGWSHIQFTGDGEDLVFDVDELRQEVLSEEDESWLCQFICQCRTCIKRERMRVKISYETLNFETGEFRLKVNVDAAYASGVIRPREGGWHDLDLESDKKAMLKKYGERLMFEMKSVLSRP